MQLARSFAPELMAAPAGILEEPCVILLSLERGVDPVALRSSARKLTLRWDLDHREPVSSRIVLRCGAGIRCRRRSQIQRRPGIRFPLGRIDQTISANPDIVLR